MAEKAPSLIGSPQEIDSLFLSHSLSPSRKLYHPRSQHQPTLWTRRFIYLSHSLALSPSNFPVTASWRILEYPLIALRATQPSSVRQSPCQHPLDKFIGRLSPTLLDGENIYTYRYTDIYIYLSYIYRHVNKTTLAFILRRRGKKEAFSCKLCRHWIATQKSSNSFYSSRCFILKLLHVARKSEKSSSQTFILRVVSTSGLPCHDPPSNLLQITPSVVNKMAEKSFELGWFFN